VKGVIEVFRVEYLRNPTIQGIQRFMEIDECHGLRGMLGRIGCVHWCGQRCAYAWNRIYTHGDHGVPTIILEEVASHDRGIWHVFFWCCSIQQ
jgi:hypothetical protein